MPLTSKDTFFKEIIEHLQGDVAILDANGKYVYVNPYAVADPVIREWIVGKTDLEYCMFRGIDVNIAHLRRDKFKQVMETKVLVEWEERMMDKSGLNRYFLRRLIPVFSENGAKITFLIGHGLDITDRRKISDELEMNKRFIETVLNTSPHLIFVKDARGRFLLANKAVADLFNLTTDTIKLKSNAELHPYNQEVEDYTKTDLTVLNEGKQVRVQEPFTKSNGDLIWFDTIKVPLVESDGNVNVLGISTDITVSKLKEDLLLKNEKYLSEAQKLTKSGNWIRHLKDDKIEWSTGMYLIWEREITLGPPSLEEVMITISKEDADMIYQNVNEIITRVEEREFTYKLTLPSGFKMIRTLAKPVMDATGKVTAVFGSVIDVTTQVETEHVLKLNEERLNEAQQMAKMGSYEFNLSSGVIKWSRGMYLIWELDESVVPDLNVFYKYLHPDDVERVRQVEATMSGFDQAWSIHYRIITPTGKVKHLEVVSKFSENYAGNAKVIVGSCIDVSERMLNEEQLRLSEQRLLEAQELSHSGSWEVSLYPEMRVDWSPGTFKIWEMDFNEKPYDQKSFFDHVIEEDKEKVRSAFRKLIDTGEPVEVNFRVITHRQNLKYFFSRGKAIKDRDGKVLKIYGTNTDVTESQTTQEKLRRSEQSLLQAQKMAKLGSWHFDLRTGVMEWTEGMYHIWERSSSSFTPSLELVRSTIHHDDLEKFEEAMLLTTSTQQEEILEFRIVVNNGRIKYLEGRGRSIRDADNKPILLYGTVMDINDRKTVEDELIRARVQAEESSKAKEYFLANISHELRTPLNGILGMARLLQKSALNTTQREYTDVLQQTAENLLVIINDVLDFAKIEAGKLSLEEISFDPARVADTAVNLQLFKAEEKDLSLRHLHEGAIPLPVVVGDPYRLNQILLNLLNNAIKFTNSGEVVLTHRVLEEDDDQVKILFSVKDTGIGIPHTLQQRIFESFTQADPFNRQQGGVGLGLTISKSLVDRQGGKIWVESVPDVGSNFQFYITYKKTGVQQLPNPEKQLEVVNLGTLQILLAEDNKVNLFITEAMLRDWGFKVDVALNGAEAVELARENNYDLILMDIQMPVKNGLEATREIRQFKDARKAGIPIIAITANTGKQAHRQFLTEGMNDWLIKPFKEETLYKRIARHIRGKSWLSDSMKKRKFPVRKKPIYNVQPLYDLSMLKKDSPENKAFIVRMLTLFIDTIPSAVDKMVMHFENAEMDAVSNLAHKIKPTLDSAGIVSLKEAIRNIEGYRDKKRTKDQLKSDLVLLNEIIEKVAELFRYEIEKLKEDE